VYTVHDEVVHLTPVELGQRDDRTAQVLSGLAPGDRVILHPSDAIQEGLRVVAVVDSSLSSDSAPLHEAENVHEGSDSAALSGLPEAVTGGSAE
jgi:hypothetical protein